MKNNLKISNKIIEIIIIAMFFVMICFSNNAQAASFSITSGISTITVGNSYTITINATGLTGRFNITHSSNVSVNVDAVWVENGVVDSTIKVTTKNTGTATVTLTPDSTGITDVSTEELVNLSPQRDTVTVQASSSSSSGGSSESSSESNTPSFTSVNETVYATSSVNIRSSYSTSSSVVGSLDTGDSVTRTGRGSNGWSRVTYNGQTAYINSDYLTTEKPEESNNKNLESITITGDYTLTPEFSADITEYELTVGTDVDSLEIEAVAEDENAEVVITGNDNLLMGENTIEIEVTAEDGTVRTYTINVTKGESVSEVNGNELGLSTLSIEGYELNPSFTSNVYQYNLDIYDPSVTSLNINAVSNIEDAVIEIVGNTGLKLGENIITILVTSGEDATTYQIKVNIMEKIETQIIAGIDNDDLFLYGGIAIAVIIVLIIIIVVVRHRRNREDDDYQTYYGGFNSLNKDDDSNEKRDNYLNDNFKDETNNKEDNQDDKINNHTEDNNYNDKNTDTFQKDRKSVIEENFGADINNDNLEYYDDKPRRKKGKHF